MYSSFDLLTDKDLSVIQKYIEDAIDTNLDVPIEYILRHWSAAKRNIIDTYFGGNKLRMKFPVDIKIEQSSLGTRNLVARMSASFVGEVVDWMYDLMDADWCDDTDVYAVAKLLSPKLVLRGSVDEDVTLSCKFNKSLNIKGGTKIMKAIRKALEYYEFCDMDNFIRFRDQMSVIMTTKHLVGTLVFSVHPIDFMSMSDNSNGWKTCTSWVEDKGCHSSGVIEMLNSDSAIVAYLETSGTPEYRDGVPNKKWRQLVFASDDAIIGGRQYPWSSDELSQRVVRLLANSGNKFMDAKVHLYDNPARGSICGNFDIRNETEDYKNNIASNSKSVIPYTFGMYNDFVEFEDEDFFGVFSSTVESAPVKRWCISGEPECMCCGESLDEKNPHAPGLIVGTSQKICHKCMEVHFDKTGSPL